MLGDVSPLTCRSYAHDLLRWFRLLWMLDVCWARATEAETAVLVGWLRTAPNPQRRRWREGAPASGSVNLTTGKAYLSAGYAPRTINHALTVVSGFYGFHARFGEGPVFNPVPDSPGRRRALAHRSPMEPRPQFRRARLRQRVAEQAPRSIPDVLWQELFAAMTNDRDRALLAFYVSSGARASELLGLRMGDVDWAGQKIYLVGKGSRLRQAVPASPEAFRYLAFYLDQSGPVGADQPVWRTLHGPERPMSYWAMRRVLQRANDKLGTNWTLHDARHTAASRMARDPRLSLVEVQTVMRHADLATTSRYTPPRLDEVIDKLAEHYTRPPVEPSYPVGYDTEDIKAVFGD
jgi:integrase